MELKKNECNVENINYKFTGDRKMSTIEHPNWVGILNVLMDLTVKKGYVEISVEMGKKVLSIYRDDDRYYVSYSLGVKDLPVYQVVKESEHSFDYMSLQIIKYKYIKDFNKLKYYVYKFYKMGNVSTKEKWGLEYY